ncbi:DUF5801 repeats-in-toxin domain-containing protein [Pseudomonas sp. NY15181]|uniref:T1SS-143 repeat domain-containing protein n=1 Tax=Pseudomonas sp. NY15181 TaxID=3400349 RepID=UPI003A8C38BC
MTTPKKYTPPTVTTDQQDYAPGSTAIITAAGFPAGSTVRFQVQHATGAGADGIWGTPDDVLATTSGAGHNAWSVTDGGAGDLDGKVNGSVTTSWYVNPDDSAGATFLLTATSSDGTVATASFTDDPVVVATGVTVTLDETAGLQDATATPNPAEDSNDNDTLLVLPTAFATRLGVLGAGSATGEALSGFTGAAGDTGSNAFTLNPLPGGSITDVRFADSGGAALNGLDSGLQTLDGTHILLYTDTGNNNILVGRAGSAGGAIVLAAYIQETGSPVSGGKIWTVEYQPLKHPDATNPDDAVNLLNKVFIGTSQDLTFSLANAPSGQNLFLMFASANPTTFTDASNVVRISSPAIIATGKDPADQSSGANINTGDTINTSQGGGPTTFGTNNQMIVEQEGIRFSFVTGARQNVTVPNLDQNEADVEANIDFTGVLNTKTASFDIVQLQSGKSAVVSVSAFSTAVESGVNFINGYGNDTSIAISSVRVINISTGLVIENSNGSVNDPNISISFNSGVATITGVLAGYRIEYTTSQDHNRVLVQNGAPVNASGNDHADFDVGGFKLLQVTTATGEIGSQMIFEDDGPSATGTPATGTVDEDGLPNGIPGGVGDVAGEATVASGSVTGIFQSGADAPLTYAMSSDTSGLQALSSGGTALVYSVVGNTLTATAGVGGATVFTFSLTSAGAYTFTLLKPLDHPAGNDENDITLNLGTLLKATDKDGDTVTAAAEKLVITVDDDTPNATGTAATGTVDEDGLPNGIPGGVGDVAGEATVATGSVAGIFHSGADVPLTYSLSSDTSGLPALTSGGVAVTYSVLGNLLTASAGAATVFTFSLNATTGAYTFTLVSPLDHPAGNDENDINISLGTLLQATDKDSDTVTASAEKLVITVDDDTPTATGTPATGTVDEDGLPHGIAGGVGDVPGEATVASGSVAGIFHSGADVPLTYSLGTDTSGLPALSSGGVAVTYSVLGNTLTASAGAATVFTFSLNATTGAYAFTLIGPLDHPAGNDENDITLNLGTLLKATDFDGDTVTAAAEKLVITVDDDTPTATGTAVTGTVDEDGLPNGIAGGVGDVPGEATVASGSVTGIFQSGADVPLTYSLGTDTSGLPALTSGGVAVTYSVLGNLLTASAGAATVFTFSLSSTGDYSFTLVSPLDHPAGNDENDITINLGTLLKATDFDGDTVTAAAEKLVITVDDDTPTAIGTPATGTVDEDGLPNGIPGGVGDVPGEATVATGSVAGIFQSGADVPLAYSLATDTSGLPALTSGGVAVTYGVLGNLLTASAGAVTVFTFSLNATTGAYTFTLVSPLDHPAGNDENDINISLGALLKATDKDGDTVTASAEKLVITVDDDTPTATGTPAAGTVDEDGLAHGIAGGVGDVPGEATVASGSVTGIFHSGADVPLTYSLSGDTSGLPALTSGGVAVTYSVLGDTLTASAGAATVFTFSLNATTGAYAFTLLSPLDHPAGNDENDITLNLGTLLKATDFDGDTVTAEAEKLVITVDDDTPTATGTPATGTVDEDGLPHGIAGGIGDVAGEATVASGSVTGIFQSGADIPLTYSLSSDTSGLPALTSGGVAVTYSVLGNVLTASAGAATVFTFSLSSTGDYSFTLVSPLDHPAGNDENDININLGTLLKATDFDGDTVTAAAEKLVITVDDDTPTATGTPVTGTVDEDGLANGIAGGVGDVPGEATLATGSVTGIFQSGADVPLTYSLGTDTSGLPALSSGGTALTYSVLGNLLTASAGAVSVFTFSLNATTGAYTFTLLKPLDHPAGNNENDITINLGTLLKATDFDGDTVTASAEKLVITVDDDTPTATGTPVTGTVDEDGLANGIAGGIGDVPGEATVATGSVAGIFQSGADVPLTYSLGTDTSGLPALSSGGTTLTYSVSGNLLTASAGAVSVFTFSLNATTGAYSFTLLKPLDHPAGNNENDITINLGTLLKATDFDGDTVTASAEKLVITVDDDTPTATGTPATGTVDEDGLPNGIAGGIGDVPGTATIATGSVTGIFQSGADVPLTYSLGTDTNGLPALNSGGVAVTYGVSGNTLTASAGASTVFTFSLNATTGAYTFTLLKPLDHPAGNNENDITLNLGTLLKATDFDGDTVTASAEKLVITVDDDTPTATGTPVTGTVDEDGLPGGIPGGIGDVAGEATIASGSVTGIFQSGADVPLTFGLSSDTSALQALSSGGTALTYSVLNNTLTASAGAVSVFTLALTAAGAYTFTLLKPLDHPTGNNENDININLGTLLQATDKDGDTVTAAAEKLVITVDDDTPTLAFGNLIGTGSILPQTGYWDKAYGADGLGASGLDISLVNGQFTLVRPDNSTTTGTGTLTEQSPSPDVNGAFHFLGTLTGDFDNNAATPNTTVDYALTAFADGSYTLDLVQGFSSTLVLSTANGALGAGGPDPVQTLTIGTDHVVFFNAVATAPQTGSNSILTGIGLGSTDPTEAQLQTNPLPSFIGSSALNVSTSGIGINNNNLNGNNTSGVNAGDDSFVANPQTLLTSVKVFIDNSVGGYDPASEELYYTAYYDDGTTSGAPIKVGAGDLHAEAGNQQSFTVQTASGKMIDAIQLTMGKGVVKIPTIQFITQVESLASDVKLSFNATVTDKDGDTASSAFAANLFANDGAGATFQYTLAGTTGARDAFNVDLSRPENTYQVTGFDVTAGHHDAIVLNGDQASTFSINNAGANSIVTVNETGGQVTTITVVGVDLLNTDIVHGSA